MTRERVIEFAKDIGMDIVGSLFYAAGVNIFTTPNDIAPGGVTGIATVLHSVTGMQVGTLSFLLNIPLLILGFVVLGKRTMLNTFRTLLILTVITDSTYFIMPQYTNNMLVSAIFGGAAIGIGLGLIFLRGSTTGGTDILGRMILKKMPHVPLGRILLVIDVVIIAGAGLYYGTLEAVLFAFVSVYATDYAIDAVLDGSTEGRVAYAISDKYEEIAVRVMDELERGITYINGEGGYQNAPKKIIMCAMPSRQFSNFRKIVFEVDPKAFVMSIPSKHIIGEGFKQTFE
ncbi:MAG: YitT family protein [Oscillospiraceae bacterium]